MKFRVLFASFLAIAALATPSSAQSPEALKTAQAAFDQAQTDYLQGKYDDAARGFQSAYAARPFPQFLYNVGASFHMKGKKTSEIPAYESAVEFYKRYLKEEPQAADKSKVEKAIGVLEAEIKRLRGLATSGTAVAPGAAAAAASQEVQELGDVKVRGLVVIITEPQNATIYLDDKKKGAFATTPWSGSIDGEHKLFIEKQGYKPVETQIAADPSKLIQVISSMSQEFHLGWMQVTSNVPGADIYLDDKSYGAIAKTPMSPGQNIEPGKHTIWVTAEGYDEYTETFEISPAKEKKIHAMLKGSPVGKLVVTGLGIEDSRITIDGDVACEVGPCLKNVPEGSHVIRVTRDGYKAYSRRITIRAKTETTIKIMQEQSPSRSDAVVAYVFAGLFGGGAIYLGTQAKNIHKEIQTDIDAGSPPVDNNDPRFLKGKIYAIAADGCFAIGGIALLTAVYYTFRNKGPPTSAQIDIHTFALQPQLGPTYAGLGMEARW